MDASTQGAPVRVVPFHEPERVRGIAATLLEALGIEPTEGNVEAVVQQAYREAGHAP